MLTQVNGSRAACRYARAVANSLFGIGRLSIAKTIYVLRTEVMPPAQQPSTEHSPVLQLRYVSRAETNAGLGPVYTSPWLSLSLESATRLRRALDEAMNGYACGKAPKQATESD